LRVKILQIPVRVTGPGALPKLRTLMVSRSSLWLVNHGSQAGIKKISGLCQSSQYLLRPKDRPPAKAFSVLSVRASGVSESGRAILHGCPGEKFRYPQQPLGYPPQRWVFGIQGLEPRAHLVVSPYVEPAGHDIHKQLTLSLIAGSLVIGHCFRSRFFQANSF